MSKSGVTRLIVNADDLGINVGVNDAIFSLMERRRITSATLMATGPAFDDAVSRIPKYPHCSFGVHLNLTQFAPLSDRIKLHPILDEKGEFAGNRVRKVSLDAALRGAICDEWQAQIEKIRSAGVKISHIDGHQHIHTMPKLFFALKYVQRVSQIRKVRISRTFVGRDRAYSLTKRLGKAVYNFAVRRSYRTVTTDEFGSFRDYLSLAESVGYSTKSAEFMTHPGHEGYAEETAMLDGDWQERIPSPVQLINYDEL